MRVPDEPISSPRLVAIPSYVSKFAYDDEGHFALLDDGSNETSEKLDQALTCRMSAHEGRFYPGPSLKGIDGAAELSLWGRRTLREIWRVSTGNLDTLHERVDEYVFDGETKDLRTKLRADFVLLTLFASSRKTDKPLFVSGLIPWAIWEARSSRRDTVACVVRLSDGALVWCDQQRAVVDVNAPGGAQTLIDRIIDPLLHERMKDGPRAGEPCGSPPPPPPRAQTATRPPADPTKEATPARQAGDDEDP